MKHIPADRLLRKKRKIKSKIHGTAQKPRIAVHRTNKYIYVQAIDDERRITIAACSSLVLTKTQKTGKENKTKHAVAVGKELARLLKEKKITQGVFDRSIYIYLGRIKGVADGMRDEGFTI